MTVLESTGRHVCAEIQRWAATVFTGQLGSNLVSRGAQEAQGPADGAASSVDDLQWSSSKSIRTSVITLASFNVLAASVTIVCILRDGYAAANRAGPGPRPHLRGVRLPVIDPAVVYPLVLSFGVMTQGILFAAAQSKGLEGLRIDGCVPVSQAMMPATFLVPFLQLALGLETTFRAIPRQPFQPRRKWVIPVCIGIVVAALLALYGVTRSLPPPDQCFASLFWYTQPWSPVCLGLLVGVASVLLLSAGSVFLRLRRGVKTSPEQRLEASHMVYYMTVSAISNALLTPFFFSIAFNNNDETDSAPVELSTTSSVVANLSGLMTGGLYLYLRAGSRSSIHGFQRSGRIDLEDFGAGEKMMPLRQASASQEHLQSPPLASIRYQNENEGGSCQQYPRGVASQRDLLADGGESPVLTTTPYTSTIGHGDTRGQDRRSSSSSFTQQGPGLVVQPPGLLPSTTYGGHPGNMADLLDPGAIAAPLPLFHAQSGSLQSRGVSVGSLETVQIGIRISNVNDVRNTRTFPPSAQKLQGLQSPLLSPADAYHGRPSTRDGGIDTAAPSDQGAPQADATFNKELPRVPPRSPATPREADGGDATQLSAAVYRPAQQPPRAKLASPKGVGFRATFLDMASRKVKQRQREDSSSTGPGVDDDEEEDRTGWI